MNKILITPIKNEAHILRNFISHNLEYFDHIILSDQNSTDNCAGIAKEFEDVTVVKNEANFVNEYQRRQQLLEEAKKISKKAIIVGLDADEFLLVDKEQWSQFCEKALHELQDHIIRFRWFSLLPNKKEIIDFGYTAFCRSSYHGSLSDGLLHTVQRIPFPGEINYYDAPDISVLHLNMFFPRRQQMKTWWYMALETVEKSSNIVEIHRLYLKTGGGRNLKRQPIPESLKDLITSSINDLTVDDTWNTWHKHEIIKYFMQGKGDLLRTIDIWDFPWETELAVLDYTINKKPGLFNLLTVQWFRKTTGRKHSLFISVIDGVLRRINR